MGAAGSNGSAIHRHRLSRRQLLGGAALVGGGALLSSLLAACGGGTATAGVAPAATSGVMATSPAASPVAAGGQATAGATSAATMASSPGAGGVATAVAATPSVAPTPAKTMTAAGSPAAASAVATPAFTRAASITEWGFGVEETNPLAFSRVEAFKKAYPSIKLEIVPKLDDQKLLTAAAAKQLPDILWLGRENISSWAARGVLRPLDDLIARDKFDTTRFYDAALAEVKYDNKNFGIPQFMTVRALYVNNTALKEAGADAKQLNPGDWNQLTDLATKLTKKSGDKIDRWGFDHKMQPQAGWLWLWGLANGGTFISADGKKASFNDPKIVEALDYGIKNYQAQGGYQAYSAVATTWKNDEQFARGQVAMTLYENWMLGIVARVAPELDFTVMPMRKRNSTDMVSFTGGNAWAITSGAKDVDAAWEFIKFMSDLKTWEQGAMATKEYLKKNNRPYTSTLTADKTADKLLVDKVYEPIAPKFDDAVKLFPQLLTKSEKVPTSTLPVGKQLNDELNAGVKQAFEGSRSAADALQAANDKAQAAIDSFKP